MYNAITPQVIERLKERIGEECLITAPDDITSYHKDASTLEAVPELVIRVRETEQISRVMETANEFRFPVTPRGGGSGLAGGCLAFRGGAVLSLEDMNRIIDIDTKSMIGVVEPGAITGIFREAVREAGLFYPPDPAGMDRSTIGGNAATSAGGPACLKYGTTKDYVLGLEVVLPSGRVIRTGARTRKGVVGYDLTHLMVGSEGTLGIITQMILKLIPAPPAVSGLAASFPDLSSAMNAVTAVMMGGHLPSALEFMDHKCLKLVGDLLPFRVPGDRSALMIIENDGPAGQVDGELRAIGRICEKVGADHVMYAPQSRDRERIWDVRRQVSLRIHDNHAIYIPEDVAVPLGRIVELVQTLPEYEKNYGLNIYSFGHAGDGNIHLNITTDDDGHMDLVDRGVEAILARVVEMGGTISGEHGIGQAKKDYLPMELSEESVRLQKGIKELFDPNGILNPGKIFL